MFREPPYDGIPCPMCPTEIRGLAATAHNFAWRLRSYADNRGISVCAVTSKFFDLKEAMKSVSPRDHWPIEIRNLYDVCQKVISCTNLNELSKICTELEGACSAVEPLSNAHFNNRKHPHGE